MARWVVVENEAINLDCFVFIFAELENGKLVVTCVEPFDRKSDAQMVAGKAMTTASAKFSGAKAQAIADELGLKPPDP